MSVICQRDGAKRSSAAVKYSDTNDICSVLGPTLILPVYLSCLPVCRSSSSCLFSPRRVVSCCPRGKAFLETWSCAGELLLSTSSFYLSSFRPPSPKAAPSFHPLSPSSSSSFHHLLSSFALSALFLLALSSPQTNPRYIYSFVPCVSLLPLPPFPFPFRFPRSPPSCCPLPGLPSPPAPSPFVFLAHSDDLIADYTEKLPFVNPNSVLCP